MGSVESDTEESDHEPRPVIIVALMLATTLGDFIEYNLFAASFKRQYRHARLIAYYRRDRPFKDAIVEMNPDIDEVWAREGGDTIDAEHFNVAPGGDSDRHADIILTPSMMDRTRLPSFPSLARFHVPPPKARACEQTLIDGGLDPDRWFCVMHYREPNFEGRGANADRDMHPDDPIAMARYVIEELEGQVVRIGHPEMTAFPAMSGFFDLSRAPADIQTQAAAVRRARFFLELSPSGPMALALSLGVPVGRSNALLVAGLISADSFMLHQHLVGPDGDTIPIQTCVDKNLLNGSVMPFKLRGRGFKFQQNTLSEMKDVAREITGLTSDCTGWRGFEEDEAPRPVDRTSWPIISSWRHQISGLPQAPAQAERGTS